MACEHLLSHITSKRLDDTSDSVFLTVECDDCKVIGETSIDLSALYECSDVYWGDQD